MLKIVLQYFFFKFMVSTLIISFMEIQISIRLFLYTLFFRYKEVFNKNTTNEASGNIVLTQFLFFLELLFKSAIGLLGFR